MNDDNDIRDRLIAIRQAARQHTRDALTRGTLTHMVYDAPNDAERELLAVLDYMSERQQRRKLLDDIYRASTALCVAYGV